MKVWLAHSILGPIYRRLAAESLASIERELTPQNVIKMCEKLASRAAHIGAQESAMAWLAGEDYTKKPLEVARILAEDL